MNNKSQIRTDFISYCNNQGYPDAGIWLWRKPTLSNPLYALIKIPLRNKQEILPAYDSDMDMEGAFQRGQFSYFSIPTNNQDALKQVKKIMLSYYNNILANSVEGKVLGEQENLTRQTILNDFYNKQKNIPMMVCPGCDGAPPESEVNDIIHEDVDHFFPKSKYPFYTIHPLNLTPYCKQCNQEFKRAKDPLKVINGKPTVALNDIFHPYIHSVRDENKHSELEIAINRRGDNEPHIIIEPLNNDAHCKSRKESLDYLLCIETRWDGALKKKYITKPFKCLLSFIIENDMRSGIVIDKNWFRTKLPLIEKTIEVGIGESQRHVAACAYVKWLMIDQLAQDEWFEMIQKD